MSPTISPWSGLVTRVALVSSVVLSGSAAWAQTTKPGGLRPLEGTYWKAIELAGKPVPAQEPRREAHLLFQAANRVAGSDGCNRISGSYQLKGDVVSFGQLAGTMVACLDAGAQIERAFRNALKNAARLIVKGDRLELWDGKGQLVAAFGAAIQPATQAPAPGLAGTRWQLVKFQGGDGKTLTPDDRSKYAIEFVAGGSFRARFDCNRGQGSWRSSSQNQVQFGPLAMTRVACPAGSLYDHLANQWEHIRSFTFKDGHLFLSLMADGGTYEFEPAPPAK